MSVRITSIHEALIPSFHSTLDAVAQERRFLAMSHAPELGEVESFIAQSLRLGNPYLVALQDDHVIGWCNVVRSEREGLRHTGTLGIGLIPAQRGQGIGRALLSQTLQVAWDRCFHRIELSVRTDNTPAVRLYQRQGFTIEGTHIASLQAGGGYHNTYTMALLSPALNLSTQHLQADTANKRSTG